MPDPDLPLLPTTAVGSYPQPGWLIDRAALSARLVPRVLAPELWRIQGAELEEAQRDAAQLAIHDMECAGLDIVTDGEAGRESYSNHFANALDGIESANPAEVIGRTGRPTLVPRVTGPIRRARPIEAGNLPFLRERTTRRLKVTIPGPFTMSQQAHDEHYRDEEALAMAFAAAVNDEVRDLFAAGADIVQLDEPWMQSRADAARRFAVKAVNRALAGAAGPTAVHMCFGYAQMVKDKPKGYAFLEELEGCVADQISIEAAEPGLDPRVLTALPTKQIMVGVLSLADPTVETPETVAERIRAALAHVAPERLIVAPDCGMKYLPREVAFGKLRAMVEGAKIMRAELAG